MARCLLLSFPLAGHMNPIIPIVRKLVKKGHEVAWITGRAYEEEVKSTGAFFFPLPKEMDYSIMEIYDVYPELKKLKGLAQSNFYIKKIFLDSVLPTLSIIDEVLKVFSADVLLGENVTPGVFLKSEMTGIPSVMVSSFPLGIYSKDTSPFGLGLLPGTTPLGIVRNQIINFLVYKLLLRGVNKYIDEHRAELGLSLFKNTFLKDYYQIPDKVIVLLSPLFDYPKSDLPENIKYVGPVLMERMTKFEKPVWWEKLNGSKPVILITQGTMSDNIKDLTIPAIEGLKDTDAMVLVSPIKEGTLGKLPKNTYTASFVPFSNLMPYVDVFVSNGGNGAVQLALANGVPIVISGATEDHMEVAARVEWSKCGINLRKKNPTPADIRDAVHKVLKDEMYTRKAMRFMSEFRRSKDPVSYAKELIEDVIGIRDTVYKPNKKKQIV